MNLTTKSLYSDYYQNYFYIERLTHIGGYLRMAMQIGGSIGNILMLIVFSMRGLNKLSVSVYLRALALCQLAENLRWLIFNLPKDIRLYIFINDDLMCKVFSYLSALPAPLSAWFEVTAGLDRFLTIIYPIKSKLIRKTYFQAIAVLQYVYT